MERLRALLGRFMLDERIVLVPLLVLIIGVWFFIELADEVLEGSTQRFDEWAVRAMRSAENPSDPIGPAWLQSMARDITALGSVVVLSIILLAVVGYLVFVGKSGCDGEGGDGEDVEQCFHGVFVWCLVFRSCHNKKHLLCFPRG